MKWHFRDFFLALFLNKFDFEMRVMTKLSPNRKMQDDFYIVPFHRGFGWDRLIFKFIKGLKVLRGRSASLLMSEIDAINPDDIGYSELNGVAHNYVEEFMKNLVLSVGSADLRASIKRQLKLNLLEILPKLYKMRASGKGKYVCDSELHLLLKEMGVKSEKSIFMTFYYEVFVGLVEKIYKILERVIHWINSRPQHVKPRLYVFKNPGRKKILWVASGSHRNNGFFNQVLHLKDHYECYFLNTESLWEPDGVSGVEEINLDKWGLGEKKSLVYSYFAANKLSNSSINNYLKKRCDKIIESNGKGIEYYASLFYEIFNRFNINLCVVGLTGHWTTSIASTISKEKKIKTSFFQDIFFIEGTPSHDLATDYVISFQKNLEFKVQQGRPKIIRNKELEDISLAVDGKCVNHHDDYTCARELVSIRAGLPIHEKLLVLIACHPVWEPHTATRKYILEESLLKELTDEPVFVIVKLHPQDDSGITKKVLERTGAKNMLLVQDFDFELYLQACDLVISPGSTTLHQAIVAGKVAAVMNYKGGSLFPKAIEYGAAISLEKEGDVRQLLQRLPSLDVVKKNSSRYLQDYHKLEDSNESFLNEVEKMMGDSTLYVGGK
jgi:hypothetical protein